MRPESIEEASALLAAAARDGRRVRIGADLHTDGLDRVLEHEAGDLTCTVEAGIRLSALQATLARAGQRLSLDPPGDPTIGACLARRLSGPLSHRYGTPRDLVLGVTLVLGDGTVASAGGKVVKNVAGYDLGKLVCGSEGRLGLIARVALRLHPLPAASATLVVETDDPAAVVRELRRSQLQPSALDVLHPGRVAVLFEGRDAAVEAQLATARALVGGSRLGHCGVGRGTDAPGSGARPAPVRPRRPPERALHARRRPSSGRPPGSHTSRSRSAECPAAAARRVQRALRERFDPAGVLA